MKKLVAAAAIILFPMAVLAGQNYTSSFKDGTYEGTTRSVSPEINDTKATLALTHQGDNVVAKVNLGNGVTEEWTWNEKTLTQKEYDTTGKVTRTYTANATGEAKDNAQTYAINCTSAKKNKARNTCDGGVDARHTWTIGWNNNRVNYTVHGASQDDIKNLTAPAITRHELVFTKLGSIDTTNTLASSKNSKKKTSK
jgi:hypothetical protein